MIALDDAGAAVGAVGAKAAELARARRAGLPVLPGVVVPVDSAVAALAAGGAALLTGGSGAARLAVMNQPLDERLRHDLLRAARSLGPSLVVRSSSPCEGDGTWAGAFVSYIGVKPDELDIAVRGCWASAFSPDVLARCEVQGIDPATLQMAVLVQPEARFEAGGTAQIHDDGTVGLATATGSPASLMAGWGSSVSAIVRPDNQVDGAGAGAIGNDRLRVIAALARRVHERLGDNAVEWGWTANGPLILQCRRLTPRPEPPPSATRAAVDGVESPTAIRTARLIACFPGPLGEELVLPWAMLVDQLAELSNANPAEVDPATLVAELRYLFRTLMAAVGLTSPGRAGAAADRPLASILDDSLANPSVQPKPLDGGSIGQARRLIGLLLGLGRFLTGRGLLRGQEEIWGLTLGQIDSLLTNGASKPVLRHSSGKDRWEPFMHAVVAANGRHFSAEPASPGMGAGIGYFMAAPPASPPAMRRPVLIVRRPFPGYAPLLWNAAGLVVIAPALGAHLIEIARSLRVPAVVGCVLEDSVIDQASKSLFAVEGDCGAVAMLPMLE